MIFGCFLFLSERKGKSGSWANITEAFREDGKRIVFINGPTVRPMETPRLSDLKEEESIKERPKVFRPRLDVQTTHGVDFGHWTIIR